MQELFSVKYGDVRFDGFTAEQLRHKSVPEEIILGGAKEAKIAFLYAVAKGQVNAAAGEYAPHEAARWTKLVQECEAFNADGTVSNYLATVCEPADLPDYVGGVLAKAAEFEIRLAQITKQRDAHSAAIAALGTPEEVLEYDVTKGW